MPYKDRLAVSDRRLRPAASDFESSIHLANPQWVRLSGIGAARPLADNFAGRQPIDLMVAEGLVEGTSL